MLTPTDFRSWHQPDLPVRSDDVRYPGYTGTGAASPFRPRMTLFAPERRRHTEVISAAYSNLQGSES
jgi:hypothetical protein